MRIGILGGTGPAGSGLAARLASIGYEAVIGSRSKYRAMETRDALVERWPDLGELLQYGDNPTAAGADLVVIATPWDSAATTAQEHETAMKGKIVVSMANALVRVGGEFQPLVPPRGRWLPMCRLPYRRATSSPPFTTCRPRSSATSVSRSTPTCSSVAMITMRSPRSPTSSPRFPAAGHSTQVNSPTRWPSRRSPRCSSSSISATRRGWPRS